MHYDVKFGIKNRRGIFSPSAIVTMAGFLLLIAAYAAFNYFSPVLLAKNEDAMQAIENDVRLTQPVAAADRLRIPSAGIDVGVSEKLVESNVWRSQSAGRAVLASQRQSVGLTPDQTVRQSPLFHLGRIEVGDSVYIDEDGVRNVYSVTRVSRGEQITSLSGDAVIYCYDDGEAATATVAIEARRIGIMDWSSGSPTLRGD